MRSNIEGRIEELRTQIEELRKEAEDFQNSKPEHAVFNARKACEAICTHICFKANVVIRKKDLKKLNLDKMVNLISQHELCPRRIIDDIRTIQYKGNTVVHSTEKINAEDAAPVLKALANVVNWYFRGTTSQTPGSEKANVSATNGLRDQDSSFKQTARKTVHQSWFHILATGVMAATATAMAAGKLLNKK